ncbi:MAG: hypothetical protein ABH871_00535 [Pseudomonadota bacterium]
MSSPLPTVSPAQLASVIHSALGAHAGILMPQYAHFTSQKLTQPNPLVKLPHFKAQVEDPPAGSNFTPPDELPTHVFEEPACARSLFTLHADLEHVRAIAAEALDENTKYRKYGIALKGDVQLEDAIWIACSNQNDITKIVEHLVIAAEHYEALEHYSAAAIMSETAALTAAQLGAESWHEEAGNNLMAAWNWFESLQYDQDPATYDWRVVRGIQNALLTEKRSLLDWHESAARCIRQILFSATHIHGQRDEKLMAAGDRSYLIWRITQETGPKLDAHGWMDVAKMTDAAVMIFGEHISHEISTQLISFARSARDAAIVVDK